MYIHMTTNDLGGRRLFCKDKKSVFMLKDLSILLIAKEFSTPMFAKHKKLLFEF